MCPAEEEIKASKSTINMPKQPYVEAAFQLKHMATADLLAHEIKSNESVSVDSCAKPDELVSAILKQCNTVQR